jgi:Tfp pilus assembly protein PilF
MSKLGTKISTVLVVSQILCCANVCRAGAVKGPEQVCDVIADAALTVQDYPTAIYLHRKLSRSDGNNALAHYHLGFAYGMVGQISEEMDEYREAVRLSLNTWDLFMNLGLAYYDHHEFANATAALETAVSLGPGHAEPILIWPSSTRGRTD